MVLWDNTDTAIHRHDHSGEIIGGNPPLCTMAKSMWTGNPTILLAMCPWDLPKCLFKFAASLMKPSCRPISPCSEDNNQCHPKIIPPVWGKLGDGLVPDRPASGSHVMSSVFPSPN